MPELLSGALEFKSLAENREEFLQIIGTGGYDQHSSSLANLSTYLHMDIFDMRLTIYKGYQVFQMKSTPGSWHEDGALNLVFGVDFFLWNSLVGEVLSHHLRNMTNMNGRNSHGKIRNYFTWKKFCVSSL